MKELTARNFEETKDKSGYHIAVLNEDCELDDLRRWDTTKLFQAKKMSQFLKNLTTGTAVAIATAVDTFR